MFRSQQFRDQDEMTVFTSSLLDPKHERIGVEKKPVSSLRESLGKPRGRANLTKYTQT